MKLITAPKTLQKTFQRLMNDYNEYHWSVAWASSSNPFFEDLQTYESKIERLIVGLHFYQTHPDFIKALMQNENVGFIEQVNGTFHPKSYLFYNADDDWELLIGSPNFTQSAFERNEEMTVLIDSKDSGADEMLEQFWTAIGKHWELSIYFDTNKLAPYRTVWNNQQKKLKSLSGSYGKNPISKKKSIVLFNISIITMTWEGFISKVKEEVNHSMKDRIEVLDIAQNAFQSTNHFNDISLDERKFIAGLPNKHNKGENLWGYFGSMKGAGEFAKVVIESPDLLSKALDQIPLTGNITKKHYENYIMFFEQALSYKTFLATSTRLLAMKRPDVFVCVDSKNKERLSKAFGITQSSLSDSNSYWEDVVMRIQDAEWYQNPTPKNRQERKVERYKVAFLDALYYERG